MSTNNITFYNLVGQTVKVCKDKYRKGQEGKVISVTKGQVMFQKEGGGNPGSVESFKVYDLATGEYSAVIYSRDVAPGRVLVGTPSSAASNLNMHQAAPQGPSVSSRLQVPSSTNQQPPSVLDSLQVTSNIQQQPQEQQPDPSPALDAPSGLSTDTVDEQEDSAAVVNEMVDWADVIGSGRDSDSDESEGIEKDVPDDDLGPPERTTTVEMTEDEKRLKLAIAKSDHLDSRSTDITANHHNNNGADDEDDAEDSDDSGSVDLHSEASARALNYYGENSESEDSDSDDGLTRYDVDNTANDGPEFERGPDDDDDLASQSVQSDSDDDGDLDAQEPPSENDGDLDAQQPPSNVVWQPAGQLLRFHAPPLQESLSLHATQIVRGLKRPGPLLEHPESKRACTAWASATVNQGPLLADVNIDVVSGIDSDMEVVQEQPDPPIQDEMILDGDEYQAPLPVDGVMEGIEELTITEGQDEMILVDEEVQQAPLTIDGDMEGIEGSAPTPAPVVVRVDLVQTVSLPPQHDAMQLSEMDEGAAPEVEQPPQVTLEVAQLAVPTHANTPPPTLCQDGTLVAPPEFDTSCAAGDPSPSEVAAPAAPAAPIAPDQDVAHEPQAASEDVQSGVSPRVGTPPPTLCKDGIRVTSPVFDASCTPDEPSSSEVAAPSPAVEPEQDVVQTPQTAPEVIGTDVSISVDTSLPAPWQDANFVAPSEFDASTAIPAFTEEGMGVKDASNAGGEKKMAVCQEVGKDGSALIGTIVLDDDSSSEGESKSDRKADMSLDDPKCPNTAEEKAAFVELTEQFRKWQLFPAPPMRKPVQRKPMQPKPVPPKPDWLLKEEKKAWERRQRQARLRRVRLQAEEKRELAERSWKQAEAGCLSTTASLVNLSKYEAETLSAQNLLQKYTSAGKDAVHAHIVQIFRQKMFLQQLRSVTSLLPLASNLTDIVAFVAEDSTTDRPWRSHAAVPRGATRRVP
jgi:hypothetical protein